MCVCHAACLSQALIALSSSVLNKGSLSNLILTPPAARCSPPGQPGMRGALGLTCTLAQPEALMGTPPAWGPQGGMPWPGETFSTGDVPASVAPWLWPPRAGET